MLGLVVEDLRKVCGKRMKGGVLEVVVGEGREEVGGEGEGVAEAGEEEEVLAV